MKNLKTLKEADVRGKKVLLRVAYDITLQKKDGQMIVPDDARIRATIPTIEYLLGQGCSLGLLSWLKRPGGQVVEDMRMRPVAERLAKLLGKPVKTVLDCVGPEVQDVVANMQPGDIVMLENVRFHPEEEKADGTFAKELTAGFDLIVYDAFAQAHRIHSSTTGILEHLPSCAGLLFEKEITTLSHLLENPDRPFIAVMGGAKISDRVDVMQNLIELADKILIGGALANTFFAAKGMAVEKSLVEDVYVNAAKGEKQDYQEIARKLMEKGAEKIKLPIDMLSAPSPEGEVKVINVDQGEALPKNWAYFDIGPRTIALYNQILKDSKMVFANGPMGLFEQEQFAGGTKEVAESIIRSGATSVIGGGDTESIVARYGWEGKFTHVSTGGGASLEFLGCREFPVMKYLTK
ncbi:MAG: phosphoglycerate kinase [Candidatus Doudnabacteria bacterium RIFCSPLOWO2_01_FULL_48_57]|uniref:Phosphoglycerate kinase n=1 Tax=Candidatus Doudnabacteria bacterium RIFCSPLOWO2_02_FULL_48_13 TaxID=1817845 RepID=A0A1F5Q9X5_9BACT|nr:MAG: phosphoglycerate kinase [Candidatus Doudnabacteria bacterium RIFCSPHIGHO2_01_48_18]OGE77061.1 MAG: phosphoglycerate kinase [Candidatus Doudnabacteria bacterium RIFCSPHIGHO2_01_FULL_48_180]OGE90989.1 MAG: phosphoglycerate kinase [Candidatus Doudnabacteria bacterium RIFCSPHIGHO2_12_FULL_47_25]OGE96351.1 MAG: phosphoglycerate kinase [Candidatus Doudnabacteria bacterium RIFCSPLOWO2_01_FULL_48_57]OGE98590.1 MAG: phosphoglycerate kinase [Candidatus Doudnabacteria bacterium RIFCSPLOWO2_02_FULL